MKKKLWLMGICICILIVLFTKNISDQLNQDKKPDNALPEVMSGDGNLMTVNEALRLLAFLGVGEDKLKEALGILTENEPGEENDTALSDTVCLSYGLCRELLEFVCSELNIGISSVKEKLAFDWEEKPDDQAVLAEEFLNIYESTLDSFEEDKIPVKARLLFVIGKPADSKPEAFNTVITDQGDYTYKDVISYKNLYTNGVLNLGNTYQTSGTFIEDNRFHIEDYLDCSIVAMVSGSELVYIKDVSEGETVLHNVYITSGKNSTVSAFLNNVKRNFKTKYKLSREIDGQVGDLVLQGGEITKISIKPDRIGGKVLVANQKFIEIKGYGKVDLDEYYKIYKIYGEMSMEVTNSILVGYEATDFVVADGKIVAALIKETIKAEDIRVLLKTNNFKDIYHDVIKLTADKDYTLTAGDVVKKYKAGQSITLKPNNKLFKKGRLRIKTESDNGKIQVLSLKRAYGTPAYRGAMEVEAEKEGLILINELPLEEYLYAVIPSEMPSNYGLQALKVQAICARSYAYNQLFANGYSEYGAHVDDSVNYQVYNNIGENKNTILAVKDTYGKVIQYKNAVITAYYFSTSCGHTASLNEVWGGSQSADYLVGKIQTVYDGADEEAVYASAGSGQGRDLSSEKVFNKFIMNPPENTYDSNFAWYRWNVTISKEDLKKSIDKSLAGRYNANPDLIQTLVGGKVNDNPRYDSRPVSTIGSVKDVLVGKREMSGIVSSVILIGSECTVKVQSEYNIRTLLAPILDEVARQDKSTVSDLSMLPSAFFIMDKTNKSITFYGGGYGHGVGMSQNGVKAMADSGKDYEEIIKHYYSGVEIGFIY